MADLFFPTGTQFIAYDGPSGAFAGSGTIDTDTIFRETTAPNSVFDTTEPIDVIQYGYVHRLATYQGTVTFEGQQYPVFRLVNNGGFAYDQTVVFGSSLSDAFPTVASLNLDSSDYPFCFLSCTRITTPIGSVAVEELCIGDSILTFDGRRIPIKWIGRQTVSIRFGPAERLMPVRFAAGSLGKGLPTADLMVTADHGMLVEGVICHAGALVNGVTITRVPLAEMGETYTVYHIETEDHEMILANGAPAETFIDNVSRRVFDNFAEFETLYGDVPEMEELPYPRAMSARQVPERIRARLSPARVA
jgi:hypothetical protein